MKAPRVVLYAGDSYRDGMQLRLDYHRDGFCRPTSCPLCGDRVFFVRHNGGSVWFDDLGAPWPKHGCFDHGSPRRDNHGSDCFSSALTDAAAGRRDGVLGVITASDTASTVEGRSFFLLGADGHDRRLRISSDYSQSMIMGRFALLFDAASTLVLVHPTYRVRVNRIERVASPRDGSGVAPEEGAKERQTPAAVDVKPSAALAAIVGPQRLPRTEVTFRFWEYVRTKNLVSRHNRRTILTDEPLKAVLGRPQVAVQDVVRLLEAHLSSE